MVDESAAAARARLELERARKKQFTPQQQPRTFGGTMAAAATGLRGAAEGALAVGDDAIGRGVGWLAEKVGGAPKGAAERGGQAYRETATPAATIATALQKLGILSPETAGTTRSVVAPTSQDIASVTDPAVTAVSPAVQEFTRHEPTNDIERLAQTAGGFLPAALSPGSATQRIARVAAPTLATEAAGETAAQLAPEYEDAARIVAGLVAGGGAEAGTRAFRTRRALATVKATPGATERVLKLLQDQGMSMDEAAAFMRKELGSEGMLMDVGPEGGSTTRQEAQRIQAAGGPGRGIIDPAVRAREKGKNQRLSEDVTATVGPREQPGSVLGQLEERRRAGGAEQKTAHAAQAQPVQAQSILDDIDSRLAVEKDAGMRKHLQDIRESLHLRDSGVPDPSSEGLLSARRALRNKLYKPDGGLRDNLGVEEAGMLQDYYAQINEAMDVANPTLRAADAKIAQAGKEQEAFETGQKIYENPRGAPTEVEFEQTFNAMTPGEQQHVLKGLNTETYRQLGIQGNDLVSLQKLIKGEGKWNLEKVATVIGRNKAEHLMRAIQREKTFNETYNKVIQGSKTAETVSGGRDGLVKSIMRAMPDIAMGGWAGGLAGAGGAAIANARRYAGGALNRGGVFDADVARMLTSKDPAQLREAARIMRERGLVLPQAALSAMLAEQEERQ